MRRCFVQPAVFILSVLVHRLVANAAWALILKEDDVLSILLLIRIEGDVFNLDGPCQESAHDGLAQVVVDIKQDKEPAEMAMYIVPLTVKGVGSTTGARYLVTGVMQQDIAAAALPARVTFMTSFAWIPLGQCRLPPPTTAELETQLDLTFDADGRPTSALSAIAVPNFINYRNK